MFSLSAARVKKTHLVSSFFETRIPILPITECVTFGCKAGVSTLRKGKIEIFLTKTPFVTYI